MRPPQEAVANVPPDPLVKLFTSRPFALLQHSHREAAAKKATSYC